MGIALGLMHKTTRSVIRSIKAAGNRSLEREANGYLKVLKPSSLSVPDELGYLPFSTAALGLSADVEQIADLAQAWIRDPSRANSDKPFLRNLLRSQDLFDYPEIIRLATHDQLYSAVSTYLDQVPWLVNLQLWWTPPNSTAMRSQLWHYDHRDTKQAKIFINLNDIDELSGPLHFLSAKSSLKVDNKVGYSQHDYTDEQIASCVDPGEILRATGAKGNGFIVDTARCLHYGSRGNQKDRLVLMISYARVNCVSKGSGCEVLDPVRDKLTETYFRNDPAKAFSNRHT